MTKNKHEWKVGGEKKLNQLTFIQYVPSDWIENRHVKNVWISGYRVFIDKSKLNFIEKIIDLTDIRLVLIFGRFSYLDTKDAKIDFYPDGRGFVDGTKIRREISKEDIYLLIITPYEKDSLNLNEAVIKDKIDAYLGLLILIFGRNIVFENIFENQFGIIENKVSAFAARCENPLYFAFPNINDENINIVQSINSFTQQQPNAIKNRLLLSLRWFKNANYDSGVDAFLKFWIALEIVAMPDNTDIRPINKILVQIYNLSLEDTQNKFNIGRLFGLRAKIVHDGKIIPIHQNLLKYIGAIYKDIYFYLSGIPVEKISEKVLNMTGFNFIKYMPKD